MSSQSEPNSGKSTQEAESVVRLTVAGFKSLREEQSIELRPLTVLAGANSAGKSSIVQPFLLLKQTLEASYDPGPLLLNGPNVRFTKAEQLLSRTDDGKYVSAFQVGAGMQKGDSLSLRFQKQTDTGFAIEEMRTFLETQELVYEEGMSSTTVPKWLPSHVRRNLENTGIPERDIKFEVLRERCFLKPIARAVVAGVMIPLNFVDLPLVWSLKRWLGRLIHLPAWRGKPERTYPVTAVDKSFPGTFDNYVASVLAKWQRDGNKTVLESVCKDLQRLGLAWTVSAVYVNDAEVEIRVNRLPKPVAGKAPDLVSIADVGFGVSQTLPVVVALHAAEKGQAVYIEQPEIHLHPRAQVALATVLADAAKRGVQVVIETHSRTLLLALQTLVANGELPTGLINLHWFTRDATNGTTTIRSATLDDSGAFGEWPEDFAQVELDLESSYISAAETRLSGGGNG